MDKFRNKRMLLVWLMLLSYCANGCGLPGRNKNLKSNNDDAKISHEICVSAMDRYKEWSFIKEFGIFNDECPEFYVGVLDSESLEALNNDFNSLVGGLPLSIEQYYLNLMDKYENEQYEKDADGNLIFKWDDGYKYGDFDETVFSHTSDFSRNINKFVDKKDGKIVFSRCIQDLGNLLENKITIYRDLVPGVAATIDATNAIVLGLSEKGYEVVNNEVETVLTINYYGKTYTFVYSSETITQSKTKYKIMLPDGFTFDQEKAPYVHEKSESNDFQDFDKLMSLICNITNYEDGKNPTAVLYFEDFKRKMDCFILFSQGSSNNPWYTYIEELINGGDYQLALKIMQSDETFWSNKMER